MKHEQIHPFLFVIFFNVNTLVYTNIIYNPKFDTVTIYSNLLQGDSNLNWPLIFFEFYFNFIIMVRDIFVSIDDILESEILVIK